MLYVLANEELRELELLVELAQELAYERWLESWALTWQAEQDGLGELAS